MGIYYSFTKAMGAPHGEAAEVEQMEGEGAAMQGARLFLHRTLV